MLICWVSSYSSLVCSSRLIESMAWKPLIGSRYVTSLSRVWGFAEDQISGTRQRHSLPRVPCWGSRQRKTLWQRCFAEGLALDNFDVLSNGRPAPSGFAEGQPSDPQQRFLIFFLQNSLPRACPVALGKDPFAEGHAWPSAKIFFSDFWVIHGFESLCECVTRWSGLSFTIVS